MNPRKMMAVALCVAACATTTAFAEDATEPINPKSGLVLSGYKVQPRKLGLVDNWLKDCFVTQSKASALKTVVDMAENFTVKSLGETESNVGMWTGLLKCKRATVYTLSLTGDRHMCSGYSLKVNGIMVITAGRGQTSTDILLKAGWNKFELICVFVPVIGGSPKPLSVSYKPKESLSDARPLTPAMMYHDQKPEEDW